MGRVLLAVLVSVILAQWLEYWYRFGATDAPDLFWGAFIPNTLIALAFHGLIRFGPTLPVQAWLLLGAVPGMALEWVVIGNAPWDNPQASQVGMFVFHACWPIWGRVFDPDFFTIPQRRAALWWTLGWTVLLPAGFLIPSPDWRFAFFLLVPLGFYAGLFVMALIGWPRVRPAA